MILRYFHNGVQYEIEHSAGSIIFTNTATGKKSIIPVKAADGYTIKINKRSISASNGARGLFSFFGDAIKNDFMTAWIDKTIDCFNA